MRCTNLVIAGVGSWLPREGRETMFFLAKSGQK
jgi:hypothetical protein